MKKILISGMALVSAFIYAQNYQGRVGINTKEPSATLNVKANTAVNSSTTKILELESNDGTKQVSVLESNGNVGIGTENPSQKLDIEGNARVRQMVDATSLESTYTKVVVADVDGNLAVVSRTNPTIPDGTDVIFANTDSPRNIMPNETFYSIQTNNATKGVLFFRYAGQSITLPPGKWIVYCGYLIYPSESLISYNNGSNILNQNVWIRAIISDNNTDELKTDFLGTQIIGSPSLISTNITPNMIYTAGTGLWLVDNTTNTYQTYYVKVSIEATNFRNTDTQRLNNMGGWAENYIVAVKRK